MRKKKNQCKVKKCDRVIESIKHKLCHAHMVRFYKWGDVLADEPLRSRRVLKPYNLRS